MRVGRFWRRDWVSWSKVEDRSSVRIDDGRYKGFGANVHTTCLAVSFMYWHWLISQAKHTMMILFFTCAWQWLCF